MDCWYLALQKLSILWLSILMRLSFSRIVSLHFPLLFAATILFQTASLVLECGQWEPQMHLWSFWYRSSFRRTDLVCSNSLKVKSSPRKRFTFSQSRSHDRMSVLFTLCSTFSSLVNIYSIIKDGTKLNIPVCPSISLDSVSLFWSDVFYYTDTEISII